MKTTFNRQGSDWFTCTCRPARGWTTSRKVPANAPINCMTSSAANFARSATLPRRKRAKQDSTFAMT
eukprot:11218900-Lingulodinium_polyedra.AAC.1